MKKIILYIRVSSKEQEEKGFSLQTQEKILREYFKDYSIVDVIHDTTSGMKLEREGIIKLKSLLHTTDCIGVLDQDRLTRDLEHLGVIKWWCKEVNVKIIIIENKGDESKLVTGMKAVVATDENEKRRERILRTKQNCFEMGRHIACPPLGYRYDKNVKPSKLIQDNNISIIKQMFELRKKGYGYLKIAKELNLKDKSNNYAFIRIKKMLENPFYAGYIQYKGKYMKGIHQEIISLQDFLSIENNIKWKDKLIQ